MDTDAEFFNGLETWRCEKPSEPSILVSSQTKKNQYIPPARKKIIISLFKSLFWVSDTEPLPVRI